MTEYYKTQITPSHFHLYVINTYRATNDCQVIEYCINHESVRILNLNNIFEDEKEENAKIEDIRKEGLKLNSEAEYIIQGFIENFFLSLERLTLFLKKGEGKCICAEGRNEKGMTYLQLTSYSEVGIETSIEYNPLAKDLYITRKDCSLTEDYDVKDLNEIDQELKYYNINQKEFDIIYAFCISTMNYGVQLLKFLK